MDNYFGPDPHEEYRPPNPQPDNPTMRFWEHLGECGQWWDPAPGTYEYGLAIRHEANWQAYDEPTKQAVRESRRPRKRKLPKARGIDYAISGEGDIGQSGFGGNLNDPRDDSTGDGHAHDDHWIW